MVKAICEPSGAKRQAIARTRLATGRDTPVVASMSTKSPIDALRNEDSRSIGAAVRTDAASSVLL